MAMCLSVPGLTGRGSAKVSLASQEDWEMRGLNGTVLEKSIALSKRGGEGHDIEPCDTTEQGKWAVNQRNFPIRLGFSALTSVDFAMNKL